VERALATNRHSSLFSSEARHAVALDVRILFLHRCTSFLLGRSLSSYVSWARCWLPFCAFGAGCCKAHTFQYSANVFGPLAAEASSAPRVGQSSGQALVVVKHVGPKLWLWVLGNTVICFIFHVPHLALGRELCHFLSDCQYRSRATEVSNSLEAAANV
jgi:hypothetical protein